MKGKSVITCCFQCEDRELGCHDRCEKYRKQKEDWEKEAEAIRKKKELDSKLYEIGKWRKRRG